MRRFSEVEKTEVWARLESGEAIRSIARRLGRQSSAVRALIMATGGVRPVERR